MINGSILCGQIVGLVRRVQPVAQILEEVMSEAVVLLQMMEGWLC